ncbi:ATP synthase F1 subunit gamma [Putridiphycobacter roseus]|uniref:ATP synthase gamma chain n=1 Tax=Putridiphycobacter roseus TaxID=2219161 RepID=A0A2W1NF09_9FLAO|nr:ATP synthase F1 subunit gamma [Putridiphycobacter roseus]PZE16656.1 ATP synthase F1 subunit gamma [Putridiphycobacter roseus]
MANLKEIRNRIVSVSSTMQITSAMKMVSAAKLKRAQDAITLMRPYADKLQDILTNLSASLDTSENEYAQERAIKNVLIIPVTSNRGLCGGFNNYVVKKALHIANVKYAAYNTTVFPIGKKAADTFKKTAHYGNSEAIVKEGSEIWGDLNFANANDMASKIMEAYVNGSFDKVVFVYNKFKNVATQIVTEVQFLPILPPVQTENSVKNTASADYIFEPSKAEIITELIPKSLKTQFYTILLESHAGEHGARMTAMHKATDNATELNKELKLKYNQARQAAITNEILEIVGGAEALNG